MAKTTTTNPAQRSLSIRPAGQTPGTRRVTSTALTPRNSGEAVAGLSIGDGKIVLTQRGLLFNGDPTEDELLEVLDKITDIDLAAKLAIGDALLRGDELGYEQVAARLSPTKARQMIWVAQKIDAPLRAELIADGSPITYTHLRAAAGIDDPRVRANMLRAAKRGDVNSEAFALQVRDYKAGLAQTPSGDTGGIKGEKKKGIPWRWVGIYEAPDRPDKRFTLAAHGEDWALSVADVKEDGSTPDGYTPIFSGTLKDADKFVVGYLDTTPIRTTQATPSMPSQPDRHRFYVMLEHQLAQRGIEGYDTLAASCEAVMKKHGHDPETWAPLVADIAAAYADGELQGEEAVEAWIMAE